MKRLGTTRFDTVLGEKKEVDVSRDCNKKKTRRNFPHLNPIRPKNQNKLIFLCGPVQKADIHPIFTQSASI